MSDWKAVPVEPTRKDAPLTREEIEHELESYANGYGIDDKKLKAMGAMALQWHDGYAEGIEAAVNQFTRHLAVTQDQADFANAILRAIRALPAAPAKEEDKHPTYGTLLQLVEEIDRTLQKDQWPRIGLIGALYWFAHRQPAKAEDQRTDFLRITPDELNAIRSRKDSFGSVARSAHFRNVVHGSAFCSVCGDAKDEIANLIPPYQVCRECFAASVKAVGQFPQFSDHPTPPAQSKDQRSEAANSRAETDERTLDQGAALKSPEADSSKGSLPEKVNRGSENQPSDHPAPQAQSEGEPEPVAWMNPGSPAGVFSRFKEGADNFGCRVPLYTHPPTTLALLREADGCFEAAYIEGLSERLAELPAGEVGSLRDLVERRLLPARDHIDAALKEAE